MHGKTINTYEAIDLFHRVMHEDSQKRLFLLEGPAETGKSHLLLNVFPEIAKQHYNAQYVMIDMVRQPITIFNILDSACDDLGKYRCSFFQKAVHERMRHPNAMNAITKSLIIASKLDLHTNGKNDEHDYELWFSHLITEFVNDIKQLTQDNRPIVFFVDNIDRINNEHSLQNLLLDKLFKELAKLTYVRIVITAKAMPIMHASYLNVCEQYQLSTVTDIESYITYCKNNNLKLLDETIKVVAFFSDYYPGCFIKKVVKLRQAKLI